jgi:hypothetical protein
VVAKLCFVLGGCLAWQRPDLALAAMQMAVGLPLVERSAGRAAGFRR